MGRPATGSPKWNVLKSVWEVRVTLANGNRTPPIAMVEVPACSVAPSSPAPKCGCATCGIARDVARRISKKLRDGAAVDAATTETVSEWFGRYFEWREGRANGAESVADSRGRFRKWIEPELGMVAMRDVTRDRLEAFASFLDEKVADEVIAAKTAANIWCEVSVGFAFAAYGKNKNGKNLALRILDVDPCDSAAGPDAGLGKTKPFLRPDEVWKLLACADVPLRRRRVYAVAIYTAMRQGEMRALRVRDVDLDTMQITIGRQMKNGVEKNRTKTGRARVIQIEPNLMPLLQVLVEGRAPDDRLLEVGAHNRCASFLREDLVTAGCTREALHVPKNDPNRAHMKFHNLRDTCLTHMAVRRDPPQDVQWRAGHTTAAMSERYIANARYEAGASFGTPLAPLPTTLLQDDGGEFWLDSGISDQKRSKTPAKWWRRRESNLAESDAISSLGNPSSLEKTRVEPVRDVTPLPTVSDDCVRAKPKPASVSFNPSDVLRKALDEAIAKGDEDQAVKLARVLATLAPTPKPRNVVDIATARKSRR